MLFPITIAAPLSFTFAPPRPVRWWAVLSRGLFAPGSAMKLPLLALDEFFALVSGIILATCRLFYPGRHQLEIEQIVGLDRWRRHHYLCTPRRDEVNSQWRRSTSVCGRRSRH